MLIAFQRTTCAVGVSMITDEDGDWDALKQTMCDKWLVGDQFDRFGVWTLLRETKTVLLGNDVFRVWDTIRQGDYADDVFRDRYIEIAMEDRP